MCFVYDIVIYSIAAPFNWKVKTAEQNLPEYIQPHLNIHIDRDFFFISTTDSLHFIVGWEQSFYGFM